MIEENKVYRNLYELVQSELSVFDIRETLVSYKDMGASKEMIELILNKLLNEFSHSDRLEEKVRSLLDFVTGFCSENLKIWQ